MLFTENHIRQLVESSTMPLKIVAPRNVENAKPLYPGIIPRRHSGQEQRN